MKKNITLILFILLGYFETSAQTANTPAALAERIAQKMADTLELTITQKNAIYTVNMELHQQKMTAREQHPFGEELREALQRIENTRDSRYSSILSEEKFLIYKQKKANLVTNK